MTVVHPPRSLPLRDHRKSGRAKRGVGFKSLTESIDTTTPGGKLVFHIFGALAEFERELIRERTRAGLTAARARGRKGGHPRVAAFQDAKKAALAWKLYKQQDTPVTTICQTIGVSRSTFYRYLNEEVRKQAASKEQSRA